MRRMLSGTFRVELHLALAEEWEKMTGASLTARASRAVCMELWERSTIIPRRFISSITVCNVSDVDGERGAGKQCC